MTTRRPSSPQKPKGPSLPTTVSVLGVDVGVEWNADLEDGDFGQFLADVPMAKIGKRKVTQTFLHEMLHAIFYVSGQSEMMKEGQEEALIAALEHGLLPLIPLLARLRRIESSEK